MTASLSDDDWALLVSRIESGRCTPFLGAGASYGHVPMAGDLAQSWAAKHRYPLHDTDNLARVAQFLATRFDNVHPKDELLKELRELTRPDFAAFDEPHGLLAELPFETYITTNYDSFMFDALQDRARNKRPKRDFCRWNQSLRNLHQHPTVFDGGNYVPDASNPLVFHMHGYDRLAESLVLTEDDYLDFLISMSTGRSPLPDCVEGAMGRSTLLFVGYSLADINFRVLFRSLTRYIEVSMSRKHIAVQLLPLEPGVTDAQRSIATDYLDKYFGSLNISVFWGSAREFAAALRARWSSRR